MGWRELRGSLALEAGSAFHLHSSLGTGLLWGLSCARQAGRHGEAQSINQSLRAFEKAPRLHPWLQTAGFNTSPVCSGRCGGQLFQERGVSPVDPVLLSGGTLSSSVHDPALKSQNVANQPRSLNLEKNFGESDQNMLLASQPEKCQDSCDHGGFLESELCLITRARKGQFLSTR